jgi:hypothetical protein
LNCYIGVAITTRERAEGGGAGRQRGRRTLKSELSWINLRFRGGQMISLIGEEIWHAWSFKQRRKASCAARAINADGLFLLCFASWGGLASLIGFTDLLDAFLFHPEIWGSSQGWPWIMELYSLSNILFGVLVESYLGCQMHLGSTKVYIAHTRTCGLAYSICSGRVT